MPDIASTTTAALTATQSATTVGASVTPVPVTVDAVSQALANLTRSIQTNATPVAAPVNNTLTLTTALGQITVQLPVMVEQVKQDLLNQLMTLVQTQRPLTLSLQPGSPPTQAVLLVPTPPGPAPQPAPAQGQPTAASSPTASPLPQQNPSLPITSLSAPPLQPVVRGQTFTAIILPPATMLPQMNAPQANTPPPPVPAVPSPIPAAPVPTPTPGQISTQQQPLPTTGAPAPLTASIPTPAPSAPASTALPPLPIGSEVTVHIDAIAPPNIPLATQPPLPTPGTTPQQTPQQSAPSQTLATVIGNTPDGKLILQTPEATLVIRAQITAPPGTSLLVTLTPVRPDLPQPLPVIPDAAGFQDLPQAVAALAQNNPPLLQQIMTTHMPQPNEALPGALLLLFGAFKQGDARGWLGKDVTDTLMRMGKGDIIGSLSRDLASAGQAVQDPVVGEWRSYPIPLYAQQQFHALSLYVHSDRNPSGKGGKDEATPGGKIRFLIDMRLTRLGAMQLDGFVQPKKLDMILRSESLLPEGLHESLRLAYIKAVGAVGYTGTLNFQVGRQHWLTMTRTATPGIVT